jgi:NADPH-dependent curcumin reductase
MAAADTPTTAAAQAAQTAGAAPGAATMNHQVRLATRPQGLCKRADFEFTQEPIPAPAEGQFVVAVSHISLDPAMRGWMNPGASYIEPVEIGEVMRAGGVGRVTASQHPGFAVGDYVYGIFGVQEHALSDGRGVIKVDPSFAPLQTYLGTLGMTGLTAYFGLLDVAKVQAGETVVVSGAAGAVGSVAGQIAKIKGARAVGIAGGPDKCRWIVDELGFDAAIDYKNEDVRAALRKHAPERVDVFFDNVGGQILDDALTWLARGARIAICGAISQYNASGGMRGPSNYMALLVSRASMTGFVVFDYIDRYREAAAELAGWMTEGRLISHEEVVDAGVDAFPETLLRLFSGENTGKLVLRIGGAS